MTRCYADTRVTKIAHRLILLWLDENFCPGAVDVAFLDDSRARITDKDGETMIIHCDKNNDWQITAERLGVTQCR